MYAERPEHLTPKAFVRFALDRLAIGYDLVNAELASIPARGGLIVVSNHPFGAADGLVLSDLLLSVRPDVLLLANTLLSRIPEMAPLIAPVDVFRAHASMPGVRMALRHLKQGGVLVLFPSGEVSRIDWRGQRIADPPWTHSAALFARRSGAPILPLHIEGRAGWPSLLAGALHPRLRTALLGRDLLQQRNSRVRLHFGQPIPPAELARLRVPAQTAYLRLLSDCLVPRREESAAAVPPEPLAVEQSAADLAFEIDRLPDSSLLCSQGPFEVYCTPALNIPTVLQEIGRLRELSFRRVQEGTGRSADLDRYDASYQHLFVWHRELRQLIGAYRLGFADELVALAGVEALYTHSLFDYPPSMLGHIGSAIELGRSFVLPEWQRNFRPLRLLWSGIAALLDRRPDVRCLFGPVSISASYSPLARTLMEAALSTHHGDAQLQALVKPRTPSSKKREPPETRQVVAALSDPDLLSRAISRVEKGSGLPVLLRQYLQLKGRFAGFNVDAGFGHSLDGLVFVRVQDIPPAMRVKFGELGRPTATRSGSSL